MMHRLSYYLVVLSQRAISFTSLIFVLPARVLAVAEAWDNKMSSQNIRVDECLC